MRKCVLQLLSEKTLLLFIHSLSLMTNQTFKLICLGFAVLCSSYHASAQDTTKYDPTAILLLDRMSDVIGDMNSCTFRTVVSHDVEDPDYGLIKEFLNT